MHQLWTEDTSSRSNLRVGVCDTANSCCNAPTRRLIQSQQTVILTEKGVIQDTHFVAKPEEMRECPVGRDWGLSG